MPDKRSLVEFKDEMLMGLYNAELKEICLFFMTRSCSINTRSRQWSGGRPAAMSHHNFPFRTTTFDSFVSNLRN